MSLSASMKSMDWGFVLENLSKESQSKCAKKKLLDLKPYEKIKDLERSLDRLDEALNLFIINDKTRPHCQSADLFHQWWEALRRGEPLVLENLLHVLDFVWNCNGFISFCSKEAGALLTDWKPHQMALVKSLDRLQEVLDANGHIRKDASKALAQLYEHKKRSAVCVKKKIDELCKDHDMEPNLQDKFITIKNERWVLPIKSSMQSRLEGVIHHESNSKQTVFMEPQELIPLNNEVQKIQAKIQDEIVLILKKLSKDLKKYLNDFEKLFFILVDQDTLFSKATFCYKIQATRAKISDHINLNKVSHPLLRIKKQDIPNSVSLDDSSRILLISGPNAGGKTVLLKSIALATQMFRCGLHICASEGSSLPFFTHLLPLLEHKGVLSESSSAFSAHISSIKPTLEKKGSNSLVLIDEICASTNPDEGVALAKALIDELIDNQVYACISSHFNELKTPWRSTFPCLYASFYLSDKKPSYQLRLGEVGSSFAFESARRVGLSQKILDRAQNYISKDRALILDEKKALDEEKRRVSELQRSLEQKTEEARQKQKDYERKLNSFEKEKQEQVETHIKQAQEQIDEMIKVEKVKTLFKNHSHIKSMKKKMSKIITKPESISLTKFQKVCPPGTEVFLTSLERKGIVQSCPDSEGGVFVLCGSMRLHVHYSQTKPCAESEKSTLKEISSTSRRFQSSKSFSTLLNLASIRNVEEALEHTDKHLDLSLQNNAKNVEISFARKPHFKKALQKHLSNSLCVKSWVYNEDKGCFYIQVKEHIL